MGGCCPGNNPHVVKISNQTTPILENDDSIIFPEGAEVFEVEGYEPDPDDDRRLICTEEPCTLRVTGIMLDQDDTYKPYMVCGHSKCPHSSNPVTFKVCKECPFRTTE